MSVAEHGTRKRRLRKRQAEYADFVNQVGKYRPAGKGGDYCFNQERTLRPPMPPKETTRKHRRTSRNNEGRRV